VTAKGDARTGGRGIRVRKPSKDSPGGEGRGRKHPGWRKRALSRIRDEGGDRFENPSVFCGGEKGGAVK